MEPRRLCKSSTDKALTGVCGGFAEYFGVDSLIVRLVLVLFTLVWGAGLWFYIIAALIMPKEDAVYGRENIGRYTPSSMDSASYSEAEVKDGEFESQTGSYTQDEPKYYYDRQPAPQRASSSATFVIGVVLVAIGALYLLRYFLPRFPIAPLFAAAAILLGIALIVKRH